MQLSAGGVDALSSIIIRCSQASFDALLKKQRADERAMRLRRGGGERERETLAVSGVRATVGGNRMGEAALCAAYAIARVPEKVGGEEVGDEGRM